MKRQHEILCSDVKERIIDFGNGQQAWHHYEIQNLTEVAKI